MIAIIVIGLVLSLGCLLIGKILDSKGFLGDVANIVRWVLRHWWLWLILAIALAVLGVIKV